MKIYHSPLFYAHIFFLLLFLRGLSGFAREASERNDGSLILVIIILIAGSFGILCGLLIDYGIRIIPIAVAMKWTIQIGLSLLLAIGWYKAVVLFTN
jgi:hypothetical protein